MQDTNYWLDRERRRLLNQRLSRRRLIQLGAIGSAGAAALAIGCGGGDEGNGGKATAGPGGTAAAGTPKTGGKVTIASNAPVSSLDPAIWSLGSDKYVTYNVYDWPATQGTDETGALTVLPNLAESFEWVDNTHLAFRWRQGIKFHDGTDFNSDAVQAYYKRVLDPATKSPRAAELNTLDHVESSDLYNTLYVLKEPDAVVAELALSFWTSCFPSPAASNLDEKPIGTGPFIFKSQQPGASYELVKNPEYWRPGEPYLDGYSVRVIPDKAVAAAALKSGEVDMVATLEVRDIAQFKQDPNFNVVTQGVGGKKVYINNNRGACKDERVRKALSLAVNRQEFIDRYAGEAFISPGPLWKGGALANPDEPDPQYDPEQAKQLLTAAGYPDGLEFEKMYTTTEPADQTDAQVLQAQWADAGIKTNVDYVATAQAGVRLATGDYELAMGGAFGEGDDYEMRNVYHSKGVFNGGSLTDPEIDRLINSAKLELNPNERKKIYWQVQKIIMEKTMAVFIVGLPTRVVVAKRVQGYAPDLAVKGEPRMQFQWRRIWVS
jgi:peptide/nickel transport system substrate-binding protein